MLRMGLIQCAGWAAQWHAQQSYTRADERWRMSGHFARPATSERLVQVGDAFFNLYELLFEDRSTPASTYPYELRFCRAISRGMTPVGA